MKGIILVGGPSTGTRFRPLSMDLPKPLFPIAVIYPFSNVITQSGFSHDLSSRLCFIQSKWYERNYSRRVF